MITKYHIWSYVPFDGVFKSLHGEALSWEATISRIRSRQVTGFVNVTLSTPPGMWFQVTLDGQMPVMVNGMMAVTSDRWYGDARIAMLNRREFTNDYKFWRKAAMGYGKLSL